MDENHRNHQHSPFVARELTRRSEFPTKIGRVSDSLMKVHLDYASTISRSFDENDNVVDEHSWSQKHIT